MDSKYVEEKLNKTYLRPESERVLYLEPTQKVNFDISSKENYRPGEKVELEVFAYEMKEDKKIPLEEGYIGLSVTDLTPLSTLPKKKLPASLPTILILEDEIFDLE